MRPSEKWRPPSPNHPANQNVGTTKMVPSFGKEGCSPNENAGFPDATNTTCNRTNDNSGFPDTTKTTCYWSVTQCWQAFLVWNSTNFGQLLLSFRDEISILRVHQLLLLVTDRFRTTLMVDSHWLSPGQGPGPGRMGCISHCTWTCTGTWTGTGKNGSCTQFSGPETVSGGAF